MKKKPSIKIDVATLQEISSLVARRSANKKRLNALVATAVFNSLTPLKGSSSEPSVLGGGEPDPVMQLIVRILSKRTGFPESDFTPETTLSDKGMTDSKVTQLTGSLNQYIQSVNGSTIAPGEISTSDTVQSVYDLVQSKTP